MTTTTADGEEGEVDEILDIVNRSRDIAYRASKRDGQEGVQVKEMKAKQNEIIDKAKAHIRAHLDRLVREARVDELKRVLNIQRATDSDTKRWLDLEDRITALTKGHHE